MKHAFLATCLGAAMVVALSSAASAQAPGANPLAAAITEAWNLAQLNMKETADQWPEDGYAFRPVDSVRTVGQMLAHVAGANYVFCSAARGEKSPFAEDHFEKGAKTKADIVKALAESLAYCDKAYAVTDAKLAENVPQPFSGAPGPRAAALMGNTGHLQEHYGNLVTYFRIKGMVPPSSRRQ